MGRIIPGRSDGGHSARCGRDTAKLPRPSEYEPEGRANLEGRFRMTSGQPTIRSLTISPLTGIRGRTRFLHATEPKKNW